MQLSGYKSHLDKEQTNLPSLRVIRFHNEFANAEDLFYRTEFFRSIELIRVFLYSYNEVVHLYEISTLSSKGSNEFQTYEYILLSNDHRFFLANAKAKLSKRSVDRMVYKKRLELLKVELNIV